MTTDETQMKEQSNFMLKAIYWLSTMVVVFLLGFAVVMYHVNNAEISDYFLTLGYPSYLVYPLAYAKLMAILIIITHRYNDLRDMVYAAYFINMTLALVAHVEHGDSFIHAALGLAAIVFSYLLGNRVRGRPAHTFFGRFTA